MPVKVRGEIDCTIASVDVLWRALCYWYKFVNILHNSIICIVMYDPVQKMYIDGSYDWNDFIKTLLDNLGLSFLFFFCNKEMLAWELKSI